MSAKRQRGPAPDRTVQLAAVFRDRRRFLSRFVWSVVLSPPLSRRGLDKGGRRAAGK